MRILRLIRVQRAVVAALLLSLLPVLVCPMIREGSRASVDHYADWLRKQFDDASLEMVDQAIEVARKADSSNLSAFLEAFVEAYNTFYGAVGLTTSDQVFLGTFKLQFLQFVNIALIPNWILKSIHLRPAFLSDRAAPVFKTTLLDLLIVPLPVSGQVAQVEVIPPFHSSFLAAIRPRAP